VGAALNVAIRGLAVRRFGGSDRRSFAISPDGSLLATEDAGGWQLELFDLRSGQSVGRFGKIDDPVAIAFSSDGKMLATANWEAHEPAAVQLWDIARRERVRQLDEGVNFTSFSALAYSSAGTTLALASKSRNRSLEIHLWDAATGEELRSIGQTSQFAVPPARVLGRRTVLTRTPAEPFGTLCFAPDGRSLAVAVDDRVALFEIAAARERAVIARLPAPLAAEPYSINTPARAIDWLGSRCVAVGCHDGLIRLYDVANDRSLPPLSGHNASVVALRVLPDGQTLLSMGLDRRLCSWDIAAALHGVWRPPTALTPEVGRKLIAELAGDDPMAAHRARVTLACATNVAELLAGELTPEPVVDKARLAKLVADVGSDDYNQRRLAAAELRKLGAVALPALRKAAAENELVSQFLSNSHDHFARSTIASRLPLIEVLAESADEAAARKLAALSQGAEESPITQWATAALAFIEQRKSAALVDSPLEDLWTDLASDDPGRAWLKIRSLAVRPEARSFLRARVDDAGRRLAEENNPQRVERLITALGADEFATRQAASEALEQLGAAIHPTLRQALARAHSLESKLRLEKLLKDSARAPPSGSRLQLERGWEALELAIKE
jgi:WD40 repeat protein